MNKSTGALTAMYKPRPCEYCGKVYTPESGNSKYCSHTCRDRKLRRAYAQTLKGCTMDELLKEVDRRRANNE